MKHRWTRVEIVGALAGALEMGLNRKTVRVLALIFSVWPDVLVASGELIDEIGKDRKCQS